MIYLLALLEVEWIKVVRAGQRHETAICFLSSRNNLPAAFDVIPDDITIQIAAAWKENSASGRFRQPVGEADVLF
jgi:hypothetical protein